MLKLLQWLFLGHCHKWVIHKEAPLTVCFGGGKSDRGTRFILRCEHCGAIELKDCH